MLRHCSQLGKKDRIQSSNGDSRFSWKTRHIGERGEGAILSKLADIAGDTEAHFSLKQKARSRSAEKNGEVTEVKGKRRRHKRATEKSRVTNYRDIREGLHGGTRAHLKSEALK